MKTLRQVPVKAHVRKLKRLGPTMHRVTLTVPNEVYAGMKKYMLQVNWSEVATEAFVSVLRARERKHR